MNKCYSYINELGQKTFLNIDWNNVFNNMRFCTIFILETEETYNFYATLEEIENLLKNIF